MNFKIAVIVPSLDRLEFLIRLLNFYSLSENSCHIYIGDASEVDNSEVIKAKISANNFDYFHLPGLNDRKTILFLSKKVKEKYMTIGGDDDFFIINSLILCANFLDKNQDYRTAQGRAYLFTTIDDEINNKINKIYKYWSKNNIANQVSFERFLNLSKNYFVSQFSLHRTDEFIEDSLDFINCKNRQLGEYTHCFTAILRGKSKYINCLHMIRHTHPKRDTSKVSYSTKLRNRYKFWNYSDNNHNPEFFFETMKKIIIKIDNLTVSDAEKKILYIKKILSKSVYLKNKIKKILLYFEIIFFRLFLLKFFYDRIYTVKYDFLIKKNDMKIIEDFNKTIQINKQSKL